MLKRVGDLKKFSKFWTTVTERPGVYLGDANRGLSAVVELGPSRVKSFRFGPEHLTVHADMMVEPVEETQSLTRVR